jgi:hypothetical protein
MTSNSCYFAKSSTNAWHVFDQVMKVIESLEKEFIVLPQSRSKCLELACGVLKERFRILKKRLEFIDPYKSCSVITCCIVSHNFILLHESSDDYVKYEIRDEWIFSTLKKELGYSTDNAQNPPSELENARLKKDQIMEYSWLKKDRFM